MSVTAQDLNQLNDPNVPVQRKFDICLAFDSKVATCSDCVDPYALICKYVCCCNEFPTRKNKKGALLKQACVDANMALSEDTKKANLTIAPIYNMNTNPPSQIYKSDGSAPAGNVFEAVKLVTLSTVGSGREGVEQYSKGSIRIPDLVLTRDSDQRAEGDNIDKVFEIKFPGDKWGKGQKAAYEKISGTSLKVIKIIPDGETDKSSLPGSTEYNPYDYMAVDEKQDMIEKDGESFDNVYECNCAENKNAARKLPKNPFTARLRNPLPNGILFQIFFPMVFRVRGNVLCRAAFSVRGEILSQVVRYHRHRQRHRQL